jgi:hypothetical protein
MSTTFVHAPDGSWRVLKGAPLHLPGEVYMSETEVRKQLGLSLTRNLSPLRLARLLQSESATVTTDGSLRLEAFESMRLLALGGRE